MSFITGLLKERFENNGANTEEDEQPTEKSDVLTYEDLMNTVKEALRIVADVEHAFTDSVTSATYTQTVAQMISSNKFTTNGGIVVGSHDNMIRAVQTNSAIQSLKFSFYNEYLATNDSPLESRAVAAEIMGMYENSIKEFTEPKSMLSYVDIHNVIWTEVDDENGLIKYKRELTQSELEQNMHAKKDEDKIPEEGAVSFEQIYDKIAHDFIINCDISIDSVRKKITNYYNNVSASLQLYQLNLIEIVGKHENLTFEQSNKAVQQLSLNFEQVLTRMYNGIENVRTELLQKYHNDQMKDMEQIAEQIQKEAEKKFEEAEKQHKENHVDSPLYNDGVYVGPVEETNEQEPDDASADDENKQNNPSTPDVEMNHTKIILYIIAGIIIFLLFSFIVYMLCTRTKNVETVYVKTIPKRTGSFPNSTNR